MRGWSVIAVALAVGWLLSVYDRGTDDTGVEAVLLLGSALVLTWLAPRVPVAIALAVGLPMALGNGSWPGLLFAGAGALIAAVARRTQLSRAG